MSDKVATKDVPSDARAPNECPDWELGILFPRKFRNLFASIAAAGDGLGAKVTKQMALAELNRLLMGEAVFESGTATFFKVAAKSVAKFEARDGAPYSDEGNASPVLIHLYEDLDKLTTPRDAENRRFRLSASFFDYYFENPGAKWKTNLKKETDTKFKENIRSLMRRGLRDEANKNASAERSLVLSALALIQKMEPKADPLARLELTLRPKADPSWSMLLADYRESKRFESSFASLLDEYDRKVGGFSVYLDTPLTFDTGEDSIARQFPMDQPDSLSQLLAREQAALADRGKATLVDKVIEATNTVVDTFVSQTKKREIETFARIRRDVLAYATFQAWAADELEPDSEGRFERLEKDTNALFFALLDADPLRAKLRHTTRYEHKEYAWVCYRAIREIGLGASVRDVEAIVCRWRTEGKDGTDVLPTVSESEAVAWLRVLGSQWVPRDEHEARTIDNAKAHILSSRLKVSDVRKKR